MGLTIESSAFRHGDVIPREHTGDGEDRSPPLRIDGVPAEAAGLALFCDDPDAPTARPWVHWVLYGLAPDTAELPAGIPPEPELSEPIAARQGASSWGTCGYRGPAPPPGSGVHHYHFKLYALDAALDLPPNLHKEELLTRISGHVLAEAELTGTYRR